MRSRTRDPAIVADLEQPLVEWRVDAGCFETRVDFAAVDQRAGNDLGGSDVGHREDETIQSLLGSGDVEAAPITGLVGARRYRRNRGNGCKMSKAAEHPRTVVLDLGGLQTIVVDRRPPRSGIGP